MKANKQRIFLCALLCAFAAQILFAYTHEDAVALPAFQDELIERIKRGEKMTEADKQAARQAYGEYLNEVSVANNFVVEYDHQIEQCLEGDRMGGYIMIVKQTIILWDEDETYKWPMTLSLRKTTYPSFKKQLETDDDPYVAFCCVLTSLEAEVGDLECAVGAYESLLAKDAFLARLAKKWIEVSSRDRYGGAADPELNQKFLDAVEKK